ncbi:type II secretion system minor pseudopilin GspH [Pseudomonas sp. REP124]|uniref:type II secretion system minor pseudopilin GspH n=1 Tax=Pseudomonas sp. REP124 TaxID=2875731 RepID=UPI001CCAE066|nr:type II secretion system minor pseudopilin GspH [Pseudomonas sp. REP124]MBZ9782288.1 type II secretion system minor pseudopilin GspH [Pseudomonas sp. REP124]
MPRRCRGFTLLEMMIVIVLIGVLVGMVNLATGGNPARQARQEADALAGVIRQFRERAVLESQEYGVRLSNEGYRTLRLGVSGWEPVTALYRWPADLRLRLKHDGYFVNIASDEGPPQLLLLSSDEISAFSLTFESAGRRLLSLSSDGIGEVVIDG